MSIGITLRPGPERGELSIELRCDLGVIHRDWLRSATLLGSRLMPVAVISGRCVVISKPDVIRCAGIAAPSKGAITPMRSRRSTIPASRRPPGCRRSTSPSSRRGDASPWLEGWYPDVADSQRAGGRNTDRESWWAGGAAPILDLQAADDPFRPRETIDELKSELGSRVTVVVVPAASHALPVEQPEAVIRAITAWARSL